MSEYYIARDICTNKGIIDYDLLLRTFTLNSRSHFNCLDTVQRVKNFKTPTRSSTTNERQKQRIYGNTSNQVEPSSLTLTPARKRPPDSKPNQRNKRLRAILRCDEWVGNTVFCRFCKVKLNTGDKRKESSDYESHLLFFCQNIPGSGPLEKSQNVCLIDKMRRLSEIAAISENSD